MGLKFSPAGARKLDYIIADGAKKIKRPGHFQKRGVGLR